jgi:hypothetical protein
MIIDTGFLSSVRQVEYTPSPKVRQVKSAHLKKEALGQGARPTVCHKTIAKGVEPRTVSGATEDVTHLPRPLALRAPPARASTPAQGLTAKVAAL